MLTDTASTVKTFSVSGPEVHLPCGPGPEEGPAEVGLPVTAQEVQPASGATDPLLHLHHRLVLMGRDGGQEETAEKVIGFRKGSGNIDRRRWDSFLYRSQSRNVSSSCLEAVIGCVNVHVQADLRWKKTDLNL